MGKDEEARMLGRPGVEKSASTASTPSVLVPDIRPINSVCGMVCDKPL
jgi:hypothetical protein